MYDKVQEHWAAQLAELKARAGRRADEAERERSRSGSPAWKRPTWRWSSRQGQNEIDDMQAEGPRHPAAPRADGQTEDLETKFKDPDDPFRLVFVCAMWMTGFDVPTCSTIYLDKPMRTTR